MRGMKLSIEFRCPVKTLSLFCCSSTSFSSWLCSALAGVKISLGGSTVSFPLGYV